MAGHLELGRLGLEKPFDLVILQGGSGEPLRESRRSIFTETARQHSAAIHETGAEVALYMTPAYSDVHSRYDSDMILHKFFDGSHPELEGTYLAACVVFASLYNESPVGNSYTYFGEISAEDAAFLQQVAQDVVADFFKR